MSLVAPALHMQSLHTLHACHQAPPGAPYPFLTIYPSLAIYLLHALALLLADLPLNQAYITRRLPVVVTLLAGLGVSSLPLTYLMQRSFTVSLVSCKAAAFRGALQWTNLET